MSETDKSISTRNNQTLLDRTETTGYPRADSYGHRLVVSSVSNHLITLIDTLHPASDDQGNIDESAPGNPYTKVTYDQVHDELTSMLEDNLIKDEKQKEEIEVRLTERSDLFLTDTQYIRAIVRAILDTEVLPESYMTDDKAILDVWNNQGANISESDGYKIACPNCFMVKPISGQCSCFD